MKGGGTGRGGKGNQARDERHPTKIFTETNNNNHNNDKNNSSSTESLRKQ